MDFLKLTSMIAATAVLTFCITFIATKNHYSAKDMSVGLCPDSAVPPATVGNSFRQPSLKNSTVVSRENEGSGINQTSSVPQLTQTSENIEAVVREREKQQQQINVFRQFTAADHKQPLIDEANHRYEAEAVDYNWASAQEDKLLSTFTNSSALDSYIPSHMSCRSSTCKIIIPSQDDTNAANAYRAVLQTLVGSTSESNKTVTYFRDPEKAEVVMYISAQGNSIFQ